MYAPPLQVTFGIYGKYMSMRYKIVGKNSREMFGEHLLYCRMERPTGRITWGVSSWGCPHVHLSLSVMYANAG